jgi:hypothetical protein
MKTALVAAKLDTMTCKGEGVVELEPCKLAIVRPGKPSQSFPPIAFELFIPLVCLLNLCSVPLSRLLSVLLFLSWLYSCVVHGQLLCFSSLSGR